ncbi:hypothetical protein EI555_010280, partial [Monodon monoceros]
AATRTRTLLGGIHHEAEALRNHSKAREDGIYTFYMKSRSNDVDRTAIIVAPSEMDTVPRTVSFTCFELHEDGEGRGVVARDGAELVRKMRVISHSCVCDGVQSPGWPGGLPGASPAEPGGVLSPEGLLPTPTPSDQQSRGQRHIRAQSCRAQAHLAGWHGCWSPPHWPCSGDNGIGAFHWMPLAPNQYYRKSSVSSGNSLTASDSVHFVDADTSQQGLPEVAEPTWWFKSFFQSEQAKKTSLF